jgi:hypothetical protein
MATLTELLSVSNLAAIAPAIEDIRTIPNQFVGLSRLPFVSAEDAEIIARVSGRETAGDFLPDGGVPLVKTAAPITLEQTAIGNFKRAVNVNATQLGLLARIVNGGGIASDITSFGGYLGDLVRRNRLGMMQRAEQVAYGMFLDAYSYSFDGQIVSLSWNKPSDLKVTPGTLWTNVLATPIATIHTLVALAADKYGVQYDRLEIGSADFLLMVATTEFQNQAKAIAGLNYLPPAANTRTNRELAATVLGVNEVVINDRSIDVESLAGVVSSTRVLPTGKVLLSRTSDDNNSMTWDFANGTVLESIVASAVGANSGVIGDGGGIRRGPFAFASAPATLTSLTITDVMRGLPRCKNTAATAVLTVQ